MKKDIENIVFDFGGVLIDLDFNRIFNEFKKIGFNDIESQLQTYEREGIFKSLSWVKLLPMIFVLLFVKNQI